MKISGEKLKKARKALKMSKATFGGLLGRSPTTITNWESGQDINIDKYGDKISELLNIDINLLMEDESDIIKNALQNKPPAQYTQEPVASDVVRSPAPSYGASKHQSQPESAIPFDLSSAIGMAHRVLASNTSYAHALFLNVVHFDRAIQAESHIANCEAELKKFNNSMLDMEKRMMDMEKTIKELQDENRLLRNTPGDGAPIEQDPESPVFTGTDDQET